jgi:hypothetical protein
LICLGGFGLLWVLGPLSFLMFQHLGRFLRTFR